MIKIVFAVGEDNSFGFQNRLPWPHNKQDMLNFSRETKDSVLVMGANTFMSLPHMLPGRTHAVITSRTGFDRVLTRDGCRPDIIAFGDIDNLVAELSDVYEDVCIIGGPKVIADSLHLADEVVLTTIAGSYEHDVAFDSDVLAKIKKFRLVGQHWMDDFKLTVNRYKVTK